MKHKLLYLVASILILGVLVTATTIITNKDIKYGTNTTLNDTGVYYGNSKAFARTADVVVCRGTSLADDLWKRFSCDVVCASTDNDCGDDINTAIGDGNKEIYISKGDYSINQTIFWKNNLTIIGSGMGSTILKMACGFPVDAQGYYFLMMTGATESTDSNLDNIALDNIYLRGNKECYAGDAGKYNLIHSFSDINFRISRTRFAYSPGVGLDLDGTPGNILLSQADHNGEDGFYLNNANVMISNSKSYQNDRNGINFPGSGGIINNNEVWGNGMFGIKSASVVAEDIPAYDKIISQNLLYLNSNYSIYLTGQQNNSGYNSTANHIFIINNVATRGDSGGTNSIYSIYEDSWTANNTITGNVVGSSIYSKSTTSNIYNNLGNNYSIAYGPQQITSTNTVQNGLIIKSSVSDSTNAALQVRPQAKGRGLIVENTGAATFTSSNPLVSFTLDNSGDSGNVLKITTGGAGMPLVLATNTTAKTCTSAQYGGIFFDGSTYYGCNATGIIPLS